ncbi:cysteine proteinase [Pluteus cervinus]|uniref:Cysteine proteinase n=1 Tax=Pluteus cervinus TaxID=181527 RepID=A0ACD3BDH1_9AGAR|nr:cysteine proteinase [Pluteus cervinus]
MQSDASSSSVKRSISDGTPLDSAMRGTQTDQMSTLSLVDANQDIDSYMAEQGEADIPTTLPAFPAEADGIDPMAGLEKVTEVEEAKKRPLQIGDTWYLVSSFWWNRWRRACLGQVDKQGPLLEQDLGPVDNTALVDSNGKLKPGVMESIDYECLPADVWSVFIEWYGQPLVHLPRPVIARGYNREATVEVYPHEVKYIKLSTDEDSPTIDVPNQILTISGGESLQTLCDRLAQAVSGSTGPLAPYRIWSVEAKDMDWKWAEMPLSALHDLERKIVEVIDSTCEEADLSTGDSFVIEFEQSDGWRANEMPDEDDELILTGRPITPPPPLFSLGAGFFDRMGPSTSAPEGSSSKGTSRQAESNGTSTGVYSKIMKPAAKAPTTTSFYTPQSRQMRPLEPGTLGLGNMGNTCFMNSALQCLAHTKELTDYFLTGVYQEELNPDNPLGMQGAIAEAFGALLQRIWADSGVSTSYSPREFKMALQRFAPQFSGYQQHDSQELVAFLLDGLHEDLNRVLKKPYVEKPDWEGGDDLKLVQLANKSWEGYMMRNDSVIVDLFQGQYQSTLVCPVCAKVSITFDPFMYLTLPLPVHKKWKHKIFFIPWDSEKPHVVVPVELGRDASFRDLRNLLGRWMGAIPENLLTLEIFSHKFFKNLDDTVLCGEMSDSDKIVCFELPCHAQQTHTFKRKPEDPFILPMFLCEASPPMRTYPYRSSGAFGYPSVVVISQEQSRSVDAMYDAVLARLERWTHNSKEFFTWEPTGQEMNTDTDSQGEPNPDEAPPEGDIVDERHTLVADENANPPSDIPPRNVGTKKGIFELRLQSGYKAYGTGQGLYSSGRYEAWDRRIHEIRPDHPLIRDGDAFFCEFDEHMKALFFGDERSQWEHARWDRWEEFVHPDYQEMQRVSAERQNKGISLQDCLDEFTKEEKLGEDDLWYCPQCKEHQQATKKFDLWKAPDVLAVHLKRFSNSRMLRDKIDAFVDFPIEGLDLSDMVGERAAAKRLAEAGANVDELNIGSADEPLIYDLFAVDEHIGGLGGGHYRAYVHHHVLDKWYHFDDSFVTPARATDAVNANAYLLFYRRRSAQPLGGKTHDKIEHARANKSSASTKTRDQSPGAQLPTPPNEVAYGPSGFVRVATPNRITHHSMLSDDEFENSGGRTLGNQSRSYLHDDDPLDRISQFPFRGLSSQGSPSSSNEAEVDVDDLENPWKRGSPDSTEDGRFASPSSSSLSDSSPFSDANAQRGHGQIHLNDDKP